MAELAIDIQGLTVFYGRRRGVIDLDLQVQRGEIFGFLGPNGAGKTTTLRVLLDLIRPGSGSAKIFGLDCQRDGVAVRQRIGYIPGELNLPPTLTARQYLAMIDGVRGNPAAPHYLQELWQRLDLDPDRRMRDYSRGNKQKVGLVAAFMHQPDLLLLDEPTGGLDPLMQQVVLELVREAQQAGRTVLFSSHILPEVQTVCERVAIIRAGRLVATERVETLMRRNFQRLRLSLRQMPPPAAFNALTGVREVARQGQQITLELREGPEAALRLALDYGLTDLETIPVALEEVFLAYYGAQQELHHA